MRLVVTLLFSVGTRVGDRRKRCASGGLSLYFSIEVSTMSSSFLLFHEDLLCSGGLGQLVMFGKSLGWGAAVGAAAQSWYAFSFWFA